MNTGVSYRRAVGRQYRSWRAIDAYRKGMRAVGLCPHCGRKPPPGFKTCGDCRDRRKRRREEVAQWVDEALSRAFAGRLTAQPPERGRLGTTRANGSERPPEFYGTRPDPPKS